MNTPSKKGLLRETARFFRGIAAHPGKYFNVFSMPAGKRVHFFLNLFIGLLIGIGLEAMEHTDLGETAVNSVSDYLIRLETAFGKPVNSGRVVYIDIDKESYLQWQTPLLAPRDRLAAYITWADRYGARVVVLDILTDHGDCCVPDRDARLRSLLASLSGAGSSTKIILSVAIDSGGEVRGSVFDDLVDEKTIFRGIPYGSTSARDRVTRYWIACGTGKEGGREKVLWGIPLLAAMVSDNRFHELKELENAILGHAPGGAAHGHPRGLTFSDGKEIRIFLDNENIYTQRIRFLMLPGRNSLGYIRSARYLKEPDGAEEKRIFGEFFRGKIVVIGNSSPDLGDIHFTPHGYLAGMFIIGNAVSTIREGLQPSPLPGWAIFLLEFVVIVLAAYTFLHLTSFRANLAASTFITILLVPATIYCYFRHAVLINAIFPVIGMSLHQLIAKGEEAILHRKEKEDDETR
jgi:hypothetical protein